ncbi:P-loop containing nucleoside triphosphate hydrolase protein [Tribonema minus]|uniref:RNA helicase n=1 Tax=Tribonema minus TaxID=303371 RepID=A0A835Z3G9_9STRA|nr:P-loop containing nucleoside triphosphate hydrolase protein [Tribonema minus]
MPPPDKKKAKSGGFQSLALSPEVMRGVMLMGYRVPTPVQRKSLPVTLTNVDTVVMARTGSGKTAAFLIPVLEKLKEHSTKMGVRSVILSPSRELALQTLTFVKKMGRFTSLRFALLVGGDSMDKQFEALANNPDVIIATPGRLMHHLQEVPDFTLKAVEIVVFDEADRLFEMGFAEQLREVMRTVPERRQTLLFSATMPKQLVQFARAGLQDPVLIRLDAEQRVSESLRMAFLACRSADKAACLLFLLREVIPRDQMTVIFTATRHHAEYLHALIGATGVESSIIYGTMDQEARKTNLEKFRRGKVKLLLVTDVAARGIDVPLLNNVVNYSFPPLPKLFVHRVGRAARQGRTGTAFSLVEPEELPYMMDLHLFLGRPVTNSWGEGGAAAGVGVGYSLGEMTPDMVHYGAFPQQILDEETESLRELMSRGGASTGLAMLLRVSENAMKQYRRTRPDASKRACERAKELDLSGIHPLMQRFATRGMVSAEGAASRAAYLKAMTAFRPKETIFEVLGGGGTEVKTDVGRVMGDVRHAARVRNLLERARTHGTEEDAAAVTAAAEAEDAAAAAEEVALGGGAAASATEQQEKEALPAAEQENGHASAASRGRAAKRKRPDDAAAAAAAAAPAAAAPAAARAAPPRPLSKAERKRVKRATAQGEDAAAVIARVRAAGGALAHLGDGDGAGDNGGGSGDGGGQGAGGGGSSRFADPEHFIGYGVTEAGAFVEGAMQPRSVEKAGDGFATDRLAEAMLDVNPDEAVDMVRKQRVLHWDARKHKFVKTSLAEMSDNKKRTVRNEAGVMVTAKKQKAGEIFSKWQKKSRREVGREGDEEDAGAAAGGGGGGRRGGGPRGAKGGAAGAPGARARDELRSAGQVRKLRDKQKNDALRSMPKEKRAAALRRSKADFQRRAAEKRAASFQGRTRSRAIVRV